ncbi:hypothetical protein KUA24_36 [Vibrio phage HNL01]|nr:hypothetical protein KUA24_36 [Vibrio phage HNL01]
MANFGKKATQQGGGSTGGNGGGFDAAAWNEWNKYINEEVIDGEWVKQPNGKFKKEATVIGVLNYIQFLGSQPQADAAMLSKEEKPAEGEEFSAEELAVMKKNPTNYYAWVDDYKDGKKTTVRKKFWPKNPEEELIFAVDFPTLEVDYAKHPMAAEGAAEDKKAYRIDYNGKDFKDKTQLGRHITNEVHWKSKKFGDKDVKYKIATAAGIIDEYMKDDHDISHLVQATCNWTVQVTKTVMEKEGKEVVFYNQKILNPTAILDIKERSGVYSKEEQLADLPEVPPFCGIMMNDGDYPKENLTQVREMWWNIAKQATTFDRNEGTDRDGEWICGEGWEGSDLEKAYKKLGLNKESDKKAQQQASKPVQKAASSAPKEEPKQQVPSYKEEPMDFDEDIPF